ncbi:MAG TPA: HAMP domain-containing histidine kinase [Nitrospirales bacterium]|nr:HAMP domain-containing histidine kinase [Nitrospirales bacterium]HIB54325.1 HAMP domain-containing histidine kinase [Nitrospirales bacterium]HIO21186.1 HAMP domain-containing histidine kinase [Nitrospirales bacterium]
MHQEPFAMGDLVLDIIVKFQLAAEVAEIRIQHNCPRDLPLVTGDIALIDRVLDNLIENAIRHTPKGGTVAVTLQRDGNTVSATVGDNGCGIPESAMPRIFDRLYQVDSTRTTSTGHGGLGLAIVKRILDLHQQSIQVESQPDRGTTFYFTLHVAPV